MATLAALLTFFTLHILALMTNANGDPRMEVHPSEIRLGISSSLDINCSFFSVDHPEMAAFASLILSKANSSGQNFQDVAAITQFSPHSVTVLTQEKVSATGVHSQTEESFIKVTWDFPTPTQAGVYRCSANGLDTLGHPLEMVNISTVIVDEANLIDIFEKLKQIEIHGTAMEDKMSEMETHIQALEYNNSQMSSYITDLKDTVASLQYLQYNLDTLGSYQNHDYYISKYKYGDIKDAMFVCKSCGGYLVEIDNENEFNAIKGFLSHTSGINYAMIAGTDAASDGTWVLQSTNKRLPFITGSLTGTDENCLSLFGGGSSWTMDDYKCNKDPPVDYARFMCEITRVSSDWLDKDRN